MTRAPSPLPHRLLHAAVGTAQKPHVHWFRWNGDDPFGNGSLYECRCGVVKPGL